MSDGEVDVVVDVYEGPKQGSHRMFIFTPHGRKPEQVGIPVAVLESHQPLELVFDQQDLSTGRLAGISNVDVAADIARQGYALHEAWVRVTRADPEEQ